MDIGDGDQGGIGMVSGVPAQVLGVVRVVF